MNEYDRFCPFCFNQMTETGQHKSFNTLVEGYYCEWCGSNLTITHYLSGHRRYGRPASVDLQASFMMIGVKPLLHNLWADRAGQLWRCVYLDKEVRSAIDL